MRSESPAPSRRVRLAVLVLAAIALANALVDLAFDGPSDGLQTFDASFDVAPPSAVASTPVATRPALLTAVGAAGRDERWLPDTSASGTRPDAMH